MPMPIFPAPFPAVRYGGIACNRARQLWAGCVRSQFICRIPARLRGAFSGCGRRRACVGCTCRKAYAAGILDRLHLPYAARFGQSGLHRGRSTSSRQRRGFPTINEHHPPPKVARRGAPHADGARNRTAGQSVSTSATGSRGCGARPGYYEDGEDGLLMRRGL